MGGRTCSTCIHDGCCEGLPHCGGSSWRSAYVQCAQCGRGVRVDLVDVKDEDGRPFCSMECMDEFHAEDEQEEYDD